MMKRFGSRSPTGSKTPPTKSASSGPKQTSPTPTAPVSRNQSQTKKRTNLDPQPVPELGKRLRKVNRRYASDSDDELPWKKQVRASTKKRDTKKVQKQSASVAVAKAKSTGKEVPVPKQRQASESKK